MSDDFDYGPLTGLIGEWSGDQGVDIAPEPDGIETNPYFDSISFTAIGDVTNAESQVLTALHYVQIVSRKSNNKVFHHQTGYWMWDAAQSRVYHSLHIPRAMGVLAEGDYHGANADGSIDLRVGTHGISHIAQSKFLAENASTTKFTMQLKLQGDQLHYSELTVLDIYGKAFRHTDENTLYRR